MRSSVPAWLGVRVQVTTVRGALAAWSPPEPQVAEAMADFGLEVVVHQPFGDQRLLGQGPPDLFRRMRHFLLNDHRAGGGDGFSH
jgi:hypothetical protein